MKRQKYTDEQIVKYLRGAKSSGTSIVEYCRKKGLNETTFYKWRKRFGATEVNEVREGSNFSSRRFDVSDDFASQRHHFLFLCFVHIFSLSYFTLMNVYTISFTFSNNRLDIQPLFFLIQLSYSRFPISFYHTPRFASISFRSGQSTLSDGLHRFPNRCRRGSTHKRTDSF